MTPTELCAPSSRRPCDLLWNGGIGTYVKAATETNADVGDKANDAIRVDGGELRAQVVGEGGNLGLTQRGRIEAACAGVRLNTDAIDNSAGVDTSDHEVNIKILLDQVVRDGDLHREAARPAAGLDDRRGRPLVLRDNYEQNVAAGQRPGQGAWRCSRRTSGSSATWSRAGCSTGSIEFLPTDAEIDARVAATGEGLTARAGGADGLREDTPHRRPARHLAGGRGLVRLGAALYFPPGSPRGTTTGSTPTRCAGRSSSPASSTRWSTAAASPSCSARRRRPVRHPRRSPGPSRSPRRSSACPRCGSGSRPRQRGADRRAGRAVAGEPAAARPRLRWVLQSRGGTLDVPEVGRFRETSPADGRCPDSWSGVEHRAARPPRRDSRRRGAADLAARGGRAARRVLAAGHRRHRPAHRGGPGGRPGSTSRSPSATRSTASCPDHRACRAATAGPSLARSALRSDLYAALASLHRAGGPGHPHEASPRPGARPGRQRYAEGLARARATLDEIGTRTTRPGDPLGGPARDPHAGSQAGSRLAAAPGMPGRRLPRRGGVSGPLAAPAALVWAVGCASWRPTSPRHWPLSTPRWPAIESVLDLPGVRAEVADLEEQAAAPDLWDDQAHAQKVTSRLSFVQGEMRTRRRLRQRVDDLPVLFELGRGRGRRRRPRRGRGRARRAHQAVGELEVRTLLSGEYDVREALVTIRAEAGGVDAADWAEMLLRMYTALLRAPRLPVRGLRHLLRRGGRHQVGHLRGQGALRLRHAVGRAGHAPARAHLAVRQPGPAPDLVRRRRGAAGRRADRPHRHP